jgi:hypothetical protein
MAGGGSSRSGDGQQQQQGSSSSRGGDLQQGHGGRLDFAPASARDLEVNTSARAQADKSTLNVYLPNGGFNVVKFGDATDIKGIIQLLTGRLGGGQRAFSHLYAMRMVNNLTGEIRSLHQDTTMYQVMMMVMVVTVMTVDLCRCTSSMLDKRRSGDTS